VSTLRSPGFDLPERASPLGIAIAGSPITQSLLGRHTALIVKPEGEPHRLIHLGNDTAFLNEQFSGCPYFWIDVAGLNPTVRDLFIDWLLLKVWQSHATNPVPYGMDPYSELDFDSDGNYVDATGVKGLTCASFVLSCFARFKVHLLVSSDWPLGRPEDVQFQNFATRHLVRQTDPNRLAAQQALVGSAARFRPEEVAAAAARFRGKSLMFAPCDAEAANILKQMAEWRLI
jgi:hypothetical protein